MIRSLAARALLVGATLLAFAASAWAQAPNSTPPGPPIPTPAIVAPAAVAAAPDDHSVLILGSTVTGGAGCWEAQRATALGLTPVVVDETTWASMTAADFATYRAIIFGDPSCQSGTTAIAAAEANRSVWGPVVNGNVIIIGSDPVYHSNLGVPGAVALIEKGIGFAAAETGKTGAYMCLSCYYYNAAPGTAVPLLDPLGPFTVVAQAVGQCPNAIHIIASSPALAGLTDADLSNWGCSAHEGFQSWPLAPPPPLGFAPLAICTDLASTYTAPDGTVGAPYIMQRGAQPTSAICLTPADVTLEVGQEYTVCAFVNDKLDCTGAAQVGVTVHFEVTSGPDIGVSGTAVTNASGNACFSFVGSTVGVDGVQASFVDAGGHTQYNTATVTWTPATAQPPDCSGAHPSLTQLWPPDHRFVPVDILGVTSPGGAPVTFTFDVHQNEALNARGSGNTCPDARVVDGHLELRAERSGPGDGRVYQVNYTADNGHGTCQGGFTVCVPHDMGHGHTCPEAETPYNSMGSCTGSIASDPTPGSGDESVPTALRIQLAGLKVGQAVLRFALPTESDVLLTVHDLSGRRVATLSNDRLAAGTHEITWETAGVPAGMYFCRLQTVSGTVSQSVLVLR